MNDWLDYKGSGSYRAYANDELAHGLKLFPAPTDADIKQSEANARLRRARKEGYQELLSKAEAAKKKYEHAEEEYDKWENSYTNNAFVVGKEEARRKEAAKDSPLRAHEIYADEIAKYQKLRDEAKKNMDRWDINRIKFKAEWIKAQNRAKEFYSKYLSEEISHAFNFRRKIDEGVKALGDKITGASTKKELQDAKQAEADRRLAEQKYNKMIKDALAARENYNYANDQYENFSHVYDLRKYDIDKWEKERKALAKKDPLAAHQKYESRIYERKKELQEAQEAKIKWNKERNKYHKEWQDLLKQADELAAQYGVINRLYR